MAQHDGRSAADDASDDVKYRPFVVFPFALFVSQMICPLVSSFHVFANSHLARAEMSGKSE